jgi:hypothetical protein
MAAAAHASVIMKIESLCNTLILALGIPCAAASAASIMASGSIDLLAM